MASFQQATEHFNRGTSTREPSANMNIGPIHCVYSDRAPKADPFIKTDARFDKWEALCGRWVRAILAAPFSAAPATACPTCLEKFDAIQGGAVPAPHPVYSRI
jgi:hypothetical protein